ncbi:MAG TPA: DUF6335 family protein [Thermoanaerobaculia bacterium]|nr:DUF6335 family protein [Thermoanaerobaculia bacterium]
MERNDELQQWEVNEDRDRNRNGIDDEIEPPVPDITAGTEQLKRRRRESPGADPVLTAGDMDVSLEMAESSGEEAVGGSAATPEQNVVDEIGKAMGVTYAEDEELKVGEKERSRDKHRWELDPASSDDYEERVRGQ